tara:strand:- start:224 stop:463 length:240 start_codon:yes stop_codon:yes gene_type:complete
MQKANRIYRKKKYLELGNTPDGATATGLSLHRVTGVSIIRNRHGARGPNHIAIDVLCEEFDGAKYSFSITLFPDKELEL